MTEITAIEKTIEVGRWKIGIQPGQQVLGVSLKGMRNRWHKLAAVPFKEFTARCMVDPDGKIRDDAVTRGVPTCYTFDAYNVCLWPSPAHRWTIRIELEKRKKAA